MISLTVMFLSFQVYFMSALKAHPISCGTRTTNISSIVSNIRSKYLVVEQGTHHIRTSRSLPGPVGNGVEGSVCPFQWTQLSYHSDRIPKILVSAKRKCGGSTGIFCDPRCKEIAYYVTVLEKKKKCREEVGQHVWKIKQEKIIVGYYVR